MPVDAATARLAAVELAMAAGRGEDMRRFYGDRLGLAVQTEPTAGLVSVRCGPRASLAFREAGDTGGQPFYHFALLAPGNRFAAARDWLAAAAPLLSRPGSEETTFPFPAWDALACYVHDPAGNVLEVIAHGGRDDSARTGAFAAGELNGISELGLVTGHLRQAQAALAAAGLPMWSGQIAGDSDGFAFVGRQAHTLILSPPGRPWLPTARPAECHPASVHVTDDRHGAVNVRLDAGRVTAHDGANPAATPPPRA